MRQCKLQHHIYFKVDKAAHPGLKPFFDYSFSVTNIFVLARSTFSGLRSVHFSWLYYTQGFFSCDTVRAYSHLHTQARSIIQMSDEQYSQYVGMLYWVDLKMWPLCSSTCRGQQNTGSFEFAFIYFILFKCTFF